MPVTGRPNHFLCVAVSPDGQYIARGDFDDSLWIWDSRRHKLVSKWRGHAQADGVRCIKFTPDGKGLMSGSDDWTIKCWDITPLGTASELHCFTKIREFSGHTVRVFCLLLSHALTETSTTELCSFCCVFPW